MRRLDIFIMLLMVCGNIAMAISALCSISLYKWAQFAMFTFLACLSLGAYYLTKKANENND